jgi:hypothetical protein
MDENEVSCWFAVKRRTLVFVLFFDRFTIFFSLDSFSGQGFGVRAYPINCVSPIVPYELRASRQIKL